MNLPAFKMANIYEEGLSKGLNVLYAVVVCMYQYVACMMFIRLFKIIHEKCSHLTYN